MLEYKWPDKERKQNHRLIDKTLSNMCQPGTDESPFCNIAVIIENCQDYEPGTGHGQKVIKPFGKDTMWRVAIVLLSCYCLSGRARHCALFGFHPRGVRTLPECAIICGSLSQCTNFTFCKDKDLNYCVMYGKLRSNACAKYNEQTMNFYKVSVLLKQVWVLLLDTTFYYLSLKK